MNLFQKKFGFPQQLLFLSVPRRASICVHMDDRGSIRLSCSRGITFVAHDGIATHRVRNGRLGRSPWRKRRRRTSFTGSKFSSTPADRAPGPPGFPNQPTPVSQWPKYRIVLAWRDLRPIPDAGNDPVTQNPKSPYP